MLAETITTPDLVLRGFRFSDVQAMYEYLQAPEMGTYLEGANTPPTIDRTQMIVARNILTDRDTRNAWAITIDDTMIGAFTISFAKEYRIAEIGYSISKSLWGNGYAAQAARAVIDEAFGTLPDLQRIQANIHPENLGSIRVAEKAGLKLEAILRDYAWVNNQPADEAIYTILRSDWQSP